jgi:activator of HSP90 ATPase
MKDYKKYYIINAAPDMLYLALTNPVIMKLWTGDDAEMSTVPGSEFSLWEGNICGKNVLSLKRTKRLYRNGISVSNRKNLLSLFCCTNINKELLWN